MFDAKRTLDVGSKLERIECGFVAARELDRPNGAAAIKLAEVEHRTSDPYRLAAETVFSNHSSALIFRYQKP